MIPIESESSSAPPFAGPLVETQEYLTQGSLHEHVIVSVPPSMSHQSAHTLCEQLVEKFDRPVLVVTHNIHFLKLEKLDKKEAEAVTERVTSRVVEEQLALAQLKQLEVESDPTQTPEGTGSVAGETVDDGKAPGGNGGGSGLCLVRGGDSVQDPPGSDAGGGGGEGDRDKEGGEEGTE